MDGEAGSGGLQGVGPRLRALRHQRRLTLAELASGTGISVSTLSRIESERRRPTSGQLLALARSHGVTLDQLVTPPPVEDPRVRPRAVTRDGMTLIPLTRRPGGIGAYKIILPVPVTTADPELRSHEGFEWMYVLSGRVRLLLGGNELVLEPGEVAEFDTRTPHWFASQGPSPAEVLALFGPQGEHLHVRARPARRRERPSPDGDATDERRG